MADTMADITFTFKKESEARTFAKENEKGWLGDAADHDLKEVSGNWDAYYLVESDDEQIKLDTVQTAEKYNCDTLMISTVEPDHEDQRFEMLTIAEGKTKYFEWEAKKLMNDYLKDQGLNDSETNRNNALDTGDLKEWCLSHHDKATYKGDGSIKEFIDYLK